MIDTDEFFVVGGTMRPQAASYIERPADAELFERLRAGEFCYVLTARQMGKSSLMVRTARRLAAIGARSVVIDLTAIGTVGADAWYLGLLSALRSQLRLPADPAAWWAEHADMSAPQRWIAFLRDVALAQGEAPLVIFIDEIDTTLGLPFRDDFFAAIRGIYNDRASTPAFERLTFALFGVAAPTDLIRDRVRTPFNIGRRIALGEISPSDAAPLRAALDAQHPGAGERILARIFHWTAGHPYLTQKLCASAAHTHAAEWTNARVDALVAAHVLDEGAGDENLKFVQNRMRGASEPERRQMLRLYQRVHRGEQLPDDDRSPIQNQLELTGLVSVASGRLRVRNRIYSAAFDQRWIKAMMPRDRQLRIAIVSVVVAVLLVVGIGLRAWLGPTPTESLAQGYVDNFNATLGAENVTNHTTRLDSLARLFGLNDYRATQAALRLFYDTLSPEQQQYLFQRGDPGDGARMMTVAGNIVATLGAEPDGADLPLLSAIGYGLDRIAHTPTPTGPVSLRPLASTQTAAAAIQTASAASKPGNAAHDASLLAQILSAWREGRAQASKGDYDAAANAYAAAPIDELNKLPALLYDRALANARRATPNYAAALRDLNAMLEVAAAMPTPAPATGTPTSAGGGATPAATPGTPTPASSTPATAPPDNASPGPTSASGAGSGVSFELHDTNRFRDQQQIRRTIERLFQSDVGLARALSATLGKGTYARLEALVRPPPQATPAVVRPPPQATPIVGGIWRIAFTSNRDGNADIYLINSDGSGLTRLTSDPAIDDWPDWSPDGARIAFTRTINTQRQIFVMNADGSAQLDLSNNAWYEDDPDWSPDGQHIAFGSTRVGNAMQIFVMNADGSGVTQLTSTPARNYSPDWSPDGRYIVFESERDGNREIYRMNADGSGQTRLTNTPEDEYGPVWSPDGQHIAFQRSGIFVMNADGSGLRQLTNSPDPLKGDYHPAWSPDGTLIAFDTGRDGNRELYIMNGDGTAVRRLTNDAALDINPVWQPR